MKCCEITPSKLRTEFIIQRLSSTPIGGGAVARVFANWKTGRGLFEEKSGSEKTVTDRIDAQKKARLVCRFIAGLLESDRVIVGGKFYNIRFIKNIENENRFLEIELEGGVAQ